jgi:hypothetical protein
MAKNRQQPN